MTTQTPEKGAWSALRELPSNVWSSIFRNPLPSTDLERASTSFTNFFLHIHPVKVHRNTLRPAYTLGLGLISLFLFFILAATGILLMFYYVPSTTQAYDRMLDLRGTVAFGTILRNMHRWSAHGMGALVFLHLCRVFLTGSYKKPREFNWVVGVILFLLTLFLRREQRPVEGDRTSQVENARHRPHDDRTVRPLARHHQGRLGGRIGTDAEIRRAGGENKGVVVVPIAFVSEHSETLVELDMEYGALARSVGVRDYLRVPTVGVHSKFISGLARLVVQSLSQSQAATCAGSRLCPADQAACGYVG